jgi:hypothetical protein
MPADDVPAFVENGSAYTAMSLRDFVALPSDLQTTILELLLSVNGAV